MTDALGFGEAGGILQPKILIIHHVLTKHSPTDYAHDLMHSSLKIIFRCLLVGLLKTLNKKAITILKTEAFQKMGDKFPNIKVTRSLGLISMGTVTAQEN